MTHEEIERLKLLQVGINFSNYKKGIDKIIVNVAIDDIQLTTTELYRIIYGDNTMKTFTSYESLIAYLEGLNDAIKNTDNEKKVVSGIESNYNDDDYF